MEIMYTYTGHWQSPGVASYILIYLHETQLTNLTLFGNKYVYCGPEIYNSVVQLFSMPYSVPQEFNVAPN
jgi:hypothetical protein